MTKIISLFIMFYVFIVSIRFYSFIVSIRFFFLFTSRHQSSLSLMPCQVETRSPDTAMVGV
jgi:hypothetical protein